MNFSWSLFVDLGLIAVALLVATFIRARVRFFQRFLIPNALTAGFILLPLYNWVLPLLGWTNQGLGSLVFHLLNISFVAMSLREGSAKGAGRRIFSSTVMTVTQYTFQAILGFALTFLFIATILPRLFPRPTPSGTAGSPWASRGAATWAWCSRRWATSGAASGESI
jgi:ESS family glutamate:Na+ symporter